MIRLWKLLLAALLLSGAVQAAEINDVPMETPSAPPVNLPLALPEIGWWLLMIGVVVAGVILLSHYWPWLAERVNEPSSHLSVTCFLGFSGVLIDSASLEPVPLAQALYVVAAVFAFIGLIGKDREGPLL